MTPSVFLVGAPKCGTTSLYDYLSQHPSVFAPIEKEPNYHNSDIMFPRDSFLSTEQYSNLFHSALPGQLSVDGCVWNLYSREASSSIAEATRGLAKIIIMLRPPISFVESMYHYNILSEAEDEVDINLAIRREQERKEFGVTPKRCPNPERLHYVSLASFAAQVERYLHSFPPENVLVIRQRELRDRKLETVSRIYHFLGIDDNFQPKTVTKRGRSYSRIKFLRRWLLKPPLWMKLAGRTLLPTAKARTLAYQQLTRLNSRPADPQRLHQDTLSELNKIFDEDIDKLSDLCSEDFSEWKRTP